MLPFCGYNMGDYFRHWIKNAARRLTSDATHLPRELVPQATKTVTFLWPGFSQNMRILKLGSRSRPRTRHRAARQPIGWMPHYNDIQWQGIELPSKEKFSPKRSAFHLRGVAP